MAIAIGRAFTKRTKRPEISTPMPYREGAVKYSAGTIRRGKISGPVELLSATNPLVYNAPDLRNPLSSSSSASSLRSSNDSDLTPTSPVTPPSDEPLPEHNHLSGYFPKRSATISSTARSSTSSTGPDAPHVPKRALSHTKKSHQDLARKRSLSRLSPPPTSMTTPAAARRHAQDVFAPVPETAEHPFSRELDKVNEVAEDFGALRVLDEEEQILLSRGLKKFTVDDYLSEIEELYGDVFDDNIGPLATNVWL